ncbi:ferritin-like domain-containing protein [Aquabacterium sp.]|uniref:ferritin-like domain-containing protein n=1 Tax=Aquabacterium sp. TaxID=1872578 RepID=UPI002C83EBC6|nr:ferritin-like domain-containing protein [Aquabacterium sp.]HSW03329.1 ferritin-like domain-containing protein [Aquabacterium sp.]
MAHPPSREQLLYWLHEASEIEHHLMCCYLYAAFSLKRDDAGWTAEQRAAVRRWHEAIMSVVFDEMSHLALVGNLAAALGGAAHMNRPPFPVDAGPYPAGFVIRLQPFSAATVEHFKFLERPSGEALTDAAGFTPQRHYRRAVPEGRLSPGPRDYETVGELYQVLAQSLDACAAAMGEAALFTGDPACQVDATLAPLNGVIAVTDLASAQQAISTIVTQGEGAGEASADSHFSRFTRIGEELARLSAADPAFAPAWPAATNPVMNAPIHSAEDRVHISGPRIVRWLDIGNALYTTSLRCLLQGFGARERRAKATWLAASFALMRATLPVGQGLAARPAGEDPGGPHAGLTFTPLRTLARLPEDGAARWVAERLGQLRQRAIELPLELVAGESAATWQAVIDLLASQQAALLGIAGDGGGFSATAAAVPARAAAAPAPAPALAQAAAAPVEPKIEVARGSAVTVLFDAQRCIHSRHCVLDAPTVFKANTPGEWIFPDTVPVETLVGVAHSCPSGAIRYQRHDGGADEAAPPVNQLRIRENGPYALHAALSVAGRDDGFRATLCRCGASKNKPWCDGSHAEAGFVASGEPASGSVEPLARRDGPLAVTPMKNGPLRLRGNLEICAGTGRTVARITEAALCRCGQSKNKPFCDMSHLAAGFSADGA